MNPCMIFNCNRKRTDFIYSLILFSFQSLPFLELIAVKIIIFYITSMEEEPELTQEPFQISESDKTEERVVLYNPFHEEYELTRRKYSSEVSDVLNK
jgi:hypothetical protein